MMKTLTNGKSVSHFDFELGSRKEMLAALAPFLFFSILPVIVSSTGMYPGPLIWTQIIFTLGSMLFIVILLTNGSNKPIPRWYLPYIGLPLPIFSFYGYMGLVSSTWFGTPALYEQAQKSPFVSNLARFLGEFVSQGFLWIGLFILIILVVIATTLNPRLRLFHQQLKEDWTLLSFLAYGTAPYLILLSFGDYEMDYPDQGPYLFLIFMIMAAGGWLYLRANTPLKKILPLFVAMSISMLIAELSRGILYEYPRDIELTWQARFLQLPWQAKLIGSVVTWAWVALLLVAPVLVKWLPGKGDLSPVHSQEGR
jgi:hypothetical protein